VLQLQHTCCLRSCTSAASPGSPLAPASPTAAPAATAAAAAATTTIYARGSNGLLAGASCGRICLWSLPTASPAGKYRSVALMACPLASLAHPALWNDSKCSARELPWCTVDGEFLSPCQPHFLAEVSPRHESPVSVTLECSPRAPAARAILTMSRTLSPKRAGGTSCGNTAAFSGAAAWPHSANASAPVAASAAPQLLATAGVPAHIRPFALFMCTPQSREQPAVQRDYGASAAVAAAAVMCGRGEPDPAVLVAVYREQVGSVTCV
jgi:hypothetical protein